MAFAIVSLGGPIDANQTSEKVELRLWNIPAKGQSDPILIAQRRVFDAFCIRHPEIAVRALVPLKIQGPAMEGNEFMAVAGGVAPDVFFLFGRKVGDYRNQGFLYPLNNYIQDYRRRYRQPYSGVAAPDKIWELCCDKGKILAVPYTYYSLALQCNNATFARAGMSGRFPKDWDELYAAARHLTRDPAKEPGANPRDPIQYGLRMMTGMYAGWHYLQYVWSAGGEVVQPYIEKDGKLYRVGVLPVDYRKCGVRLSNEASYYRDGDLQKNDLQRRGLPTDYSSADLQWRLETNSPKAMQAFLFYRKLVHQPWFRNGDHEFDITPEMLKRRRAVDPLTSTVFNLDDPAVRKRIYYGVTDASDQQIGTAQLERAEYAMQIWTLESTNTADAALSTLVPFPHRKGALPAAFTAGAYLGINAAIPAEDAPGRRSIRAVRDAAWKYVEFVTGPEAQAIMLKTFTEYGCAEFVRPTLLSEAGYGDMLSRVPPERRRLWDDLEKHGHVEPYCPGFTHVMTRELGMAIEAIVNDRPDPMTGGYQRDPQRVMDELVRNVNNMILGKMPEREVRRRSIIGWIVFTVAVIALAFAVRQVVRLALRAQGKHRDNEGFGVGGHPARRRLYAWILLVPAVATIVIWSYYPLLRGLVMAFQDYRILGGSSYVGLRNFVEAVSEPKFWRYLVQTLQYTLMLVGIGFVIPIALAVFLHEIPRGKVVFRTIYYLPAVTSGLVTLFLWKGLMYDPSSTGIINRMVLWLNSWPLWLVIAARGAVIAAFLALALAAMLQTRQQAATLRTRLFFGLLGAAIITVLGHEAVTAASSEGLLRSLTTAFELKPQTFLQDPSLAMLWVVLPVIWASAGPGCLIYLAALKGIPEEQYEAADLDGAGYWHKLMNVTYPNLKALIIINLVGAVIAAFKESGNIFVMTGGGPEDATMTTGLYIWYNAFLFLNFGLATAMAWIMGALLVGFTLKQLQILNNIQFRSTAVEAEAKGGGA